MYRNGSICFVPFRIPRTLMDGSRLLCRIFVENSSKFVSVRTENNLLFNVRHLFLQFRRNLWSSMKKIFKTASRPKISEIVQAHFKSPGWSSSKFSRSEQEITYLLSVVSLLNFHYSGSKSWNSSLWSVPVKPKSCKSENLDPEYFL